MGTMKKQINQYNFFKNVALDENGCLCINGLDELIDVIDKISGGTTNNITNNFNTTNNITNNITNNYNKPHQKPNKPIEEEIIVIKGCGFKYKKKEPKKPCGGNGVLYSSGNKKVKKKVINIANVEEKFRWWCSYSKTPGKCFDKLMSDNTPSAPKKVIKTDGIKIKSKKSSSIIIKG